MTTISKTTSMESMTSKAPTKHTVEFAPSIAYSETDSIETELQDSSFDPENAKPENDGNGYEDGNGDGNGDEPRDDQWMNLAFLPLLLLLLALQFSLLLSEYVIDVDNGMLAQASLLGSMTIGIAAMVGLFQQIWAGKVHIRKDRRQNVQVNTILRDNLSLVGIIFFCPFACLLDIFDIFDEVICGKASNLTFYILHIVFITMELLFCVQFRRLVLKKTVSRIRKFCVKLSLTVVVAANIGIWFNVVLHETMPQSHEAPSGNGTVTSYVNCLRSNNSTVGKTVRQALYPFSVELSILVLEFFASHLIFKREHDDDDEDMELELSAVTSSSEDFPDFPDFPKTPRRYSLKSIADARQSFVFNVTSPLVIIFGVFLNLLNISFAFYSRDEVFDKDVLHKTKINNQAFIIFYWLIMILLMSIGFASARNFKTFKNTLKGIDYVVVVTAFGPFICFLIRIIVVAKNMEKVMSAKYNPVIIWLPELLNLLQILLQLPFMFFADCIRRPTEDEERKTHWRIFKATVLSVAMCNITLWMLDSILLDPNIISKIFVESQKWAILDKIFHPFEVFFRFNSFLILLRAYLR